MVQHVMTATEESSAGKLAISYEPESAFLETERAFHSSLGGLTADSQGREVLIGLTFDETQFYLAFIRAFGREKTRDREVRERHQSLRKRYELARDGASA